MQTKNKVLIYDLDDTLVDTSEVYYSVREKFLQILIDEGFPSEKILDLFETIDTKNITIYGHRPERYKISMLETYDSCCKKFSFLIKDNILKELEKCGKTILEKMPLLIDNALELLEWGYKNYRQVLFTRGLESLQIQKITHVGLTHFFDKIKVVSTKDKQILSGFLSEINACKEDCWIIGDSVKSDINPAIELGINCILYLYQHHSYFWRQEYGEQAKGDFYCVKNLLEIKDVIENPNNFKKMCRLG